MITVGQVLDVLQPHDVVTINFGKGSELEFQKDDYIMPILFRDYVVESMIPYRIDPVPAFQLNIKMINEPVKADTCEYQDAP